jgi:hypothetical protein
MKSLLDDCPLKDMLDFFNSNEPEEIRKAALAKREVTPTDSQEVQDESTRT